MTTEPAVHAARGAALLDNEIPGWAADIDLSTLDIDDPSECILGQLYGHPEDYFDGYLTGLDTLGIPLGTGESAEYGFNGPNENDSLTAAWRVEIKKRR